MKICKTFRWEMGHRLPEHHGKCRNLHGHSYRMEVEVEGEPGEDGMIIDFYEIGVVVKPLIEELDHAFMVQDCDAELLDYLVRNEMKHVVIAVPSTVENIATWFADRLEPALQQAENVDTFELRIWETESSSCSLSRSV